jgi:hypothetical protein
MTTPLAGTGARRLRSRAFVQPLLITIVGTLASLAIYLMAVRSSNPPCPDASCGLLHYEINLLISGAFLLFLPLVGMIITGLVVGQTSRDLGLAGNAILAGMPIVWFVLIFATEQDVLLSSVVSVVSLGLVGIGFMLGRRGRSSLGEQGLASPKNGAAPPAGWQAAQMSAAKRRETPKNDPT